MALNFSQSLSPTLQSSPAARAPHSTIRKPHSMLARAKASRL